MRSKGLLLLGILIASWIHCFPQSDSLATYPVPKWKLWRLINAYQMLPTCDSALVKTNQALQSANITIETSGKLIELRTKQRDLKTHEAEIWEERFNNINDYYRKEVKQQRNKGRREGLIIGGAFVVLMAVFGH